MHRPHICYCKICDFICANVNASLEHTKVYELENGDNHSKTVE